MPTAQAAAVENGKVVPACPACKSPLARKGDVCRVCADKARNFQPQPKPGPGRPKLCPTCGGRINTFNGLCARCPVTPAEPQAAPPSRPAPAAPVAEFAAAETTFRPKPEPPPKLGTVHPVEAMLDDLASCRFNPGPVPENILPVPPWKVSADQPGQAMIVRGKAPDETRWVPAGPPLADAVAAVVRAVDGLSGEDRRRVLLGAMVVHGDAQAAWQ